jgi:hypothetical protein
LLALCSPLPSPHSATIISDTFTDTNGTAITSHVPDVNLTGNAWTTSTVNSFVNTSATIQNNAYNTGPFSSSAININSNGGYVRPNELTISATLTPNNITTDGEAYRGVGLGFFSSFSTTQNYFNFVGVVLDPTGRVSLIRTDNNYGTTVVAQQAYTLGTFDAAIPHTLSYSINSSTGAISNISLSDVNGTQNYSFTTTIFSSANTSLAGFYATQTSPHGTAGKSAFVDNFTVSAIPEPSTYAFIGGALALGLAVTRRRFAPRD